MAKHRLRHQAQQIAQAQAAPQRHALHRQIHATRRDERRTAASIASMSGAEQAAISQARREIRNNTNLTQADRAAALAELSTQRLNVAAGADYLTRESRQTFAGQRSDLRSSLVDLAGEQGANAASALQQLIATRQATKADTSAAVSQRHFDAHQAALDRAATVAHDERVLGTAHKTAQVVAQQLIQQKGVPLTQPDWAAFQQQIAASEGVTPEQAAQVVSQIRKHAVALITGQAVGAGATGQGSPGGVAGAVGSQIGSVVDALRAAQQKQALATAAGG